MTQTRRLFWEDPYCREFTAVVQETGEHEGQFAAVLNQTAFYPTSGGQPNDLGQLGGVPVVDVVEARDHILHLLAEPLSPGRVVGHIDWARRLYHMQQHTGQHILSQAFERVLSAKTVSFHLGEASCSIDLDRDDCDLADLARVEDLANCVVMENRPVLAHELAPGDTASLSLRAELPDHDRVRIVSITDFDQCACCGTHLRNTGETGPIHIRRSAPQRDGTRVEFLCGHRAIADYRDRDRVLQQAARGLSVGSEELIQAIERVRAAEAAARREVVSLRKRLLESEWPVFLAQAESINGLRVICRVLGGYDSGNMRYVAQRVTEQPGVVALLAVTDPSPQFCFVRSQDVACDMGALLHQAAAPFGGRGGGRPHAAQGGNVAAEDLGKLLDDARRRLESPDVEQG